MMAAAAEAQAADAEIVPDLAVSNAPVPLQSPNEEEQVYYQDDMDAIDNHEGEDQSLSENGSTKYTEAWESMFERLVRYKWKHGDCLVPTHYKKDPKLGRWVMNQRHKKDQLSPVRRQRLKAIGFMW